MSDYMRLASNMAHKSDSKSFRLGAVVVKKRRVVSTGYNNMHKTHPIMREYSHYKFAKVTKSLHAEVDACIGLSRDELKGATLYVVRILKNGSWANSNPCKICRKFLTAMRIRQIMFINADGALEMEKL